MLFRSFWDKPKVAKDFTHLVQDSWSLCFAWEILRNYRICKFALFGGLKLVARRILLFAKAKSSKNFFKDSRFADTNCIRPKTTRAYIEYASSPCSRLSKPSYSTSSSTRRLVNSDMTLKITKLTIADSTAHTTIAKICSTNK